jgi:hypothetical protein
VRFPGPAARRMPDREGDGSQDSPPCFMPRPCVGPWPGHVRDMTVQGGRSKDRVVRLEPFFRNAPVVPPAGPQAARLRDSTAAAVLSKRTEIRLETPDSSWVTPYRVVAAAMVFFEWVTTMNWVAERKSRSTAT